MGKHRRQRKSKLVSLSHLAKLNKHDQDLSSEDEQVDLPFKPQTNFLPELKAAMKTEEKLKTKSKVIKQTFPQIQFDGEFENNWQKRYDMTVEDWQKLQEKQLVKNKIQLQDNLVSIETRDSPQFSLKRTLHPRLIKNKETLAQLGLTFPLQRFQEEQLPKSASATHALSIMQTYHDLTYEYQTGDDLKRYREAYITHALNHVLQERDLAVENDNKKQEEEMKDQVTIGNVFKLAGHEVSESEEEEKQVDENKEIEYEMVKSAEKVEKVPEKDLGLTKPKILILAPFKKMAYEIVERIVFQLNQNKWKKVSKKKKFKDEFEAEDEAYNDFFRVGLGFGPSGAVKLYEPFSRADIIVASPLGLRLLTGQETDKRRNFDFLSSIDILILDSAEAFIYQNTEHIEEVLKAVNLVPKKLEEINDISRIKETYLEKLGKHMRQSIVLHKMQALDLEYLVDTYLRTCAKGHISITHNWPSFGKEMANQYHMKIDLKRLNIDSIEMADDTRFNYFTKQVWPKINEDLTGYTIIFAPTYFDFVRLRTFIKQANGSCAMVSEYSEPSQAQRQRAHFETERKRFILISERTLVFSKINLRFAKNLIFYGLPESPDVTQLLFDLLPKSNFKKVLKTRIGNAPEADSEKTKEDLLKMLEQERKVQVYFSKFDRYQLERFAGSDYYTQMVTDYKDKFTIFGQ